MTSFRRQLTSLVGTIATEERANQVVKPLMHSPGLDGN